ncbi:MAG: hypothetical protein LBI78_01345 [Campylobacteraceae bacterium]|jgi:hypothetical protein|nr:hypothetical protein [Campylobacteraceae bacterium]
MKKLIMVLKILLILSALLLPILSIIYLYRNSITENTVGFLWMFPVALACHKLRKYNRLFLDRSFGVKSLQELSKIKAKVRIEIFADILQNISFVHTILFTIISLMFLYDGSKHNGIIIFGIFCAIVLNAFTYLLIPKYEELLISSFGNGYKKIGKELVKSIKKLCQKREKNTLKKIMTSLFIIFAFIISMGISITVITMFICDKEYILAMFFTSITIIMFISTFAAVIYYILNLAVEKKHDLSFEIMTTVAICLYFFGNKDDE